MEGDEVERRHCRICGTEFVSKRLVFCSKLCQQEHERRRDRIRNRGPQRRSNRKRNPAYWARKAARAQLRVKRKRHEARLALDLHCVRCGNSIPVSGSKRLYCSPTCSAAANGPVKLSPEEKQRRRAESQAKRAADQAYQHQKRTRREAARLKRKPRKRIEDRAYREHNPEYRERERQRRWAARGVETTKQQRRHLQARAERTRKQREIIEGLRKIGFIDRHLEIIPAQLPLEPPPPLLAAIDYERLAAEAGSKPRLRFLEGGAMALPRPSWTALMRDPQFRVWHYQRTAHRYKQSGRVPAEADRKRGRDYTSRRRELFQGLRELGWIDKNYNVIPRPLSPEQTEALRRLFPDGPLLEFTTNYIYRN